LEFSLLSKGIKGILWVGFITQIKIKSYGQPAGGKFAAEGKSKPDFAGGSGCHQWYPRVGFWKNNDYHSGWSDYQQRNNEDGAGTEE